jgi:hypothetical protein
MGPADGGGGWGEGSRTKTEGTHVEVALTEKQRRFDRFRRARWQATVVERTNGTGTRERGLQWRSSRGNGHAKGGIDTALVALKPRPRERKWGGGPVHRCTSDGGMWQLGSGGTHVGGRHWHMGHGG